MKNKEIRKLFLTLILFSLSDGIYYNFQELWLGDNGMSVRTISIIYSLCALLTVSSIFLCSNYIKQKKIKKFTCAFLFIKALSILVIYFLNGTGYNIVIKLLVMIDYILDVEIYACIYPMMSLINKDNKIYAERGLVYSFVYYFGVAFTTILLGKSIKGLNISFNAYVLIGAILAFLAFLVLVRTDIDKYHIKDETPEKELIFKLLKRIKNDKITILYIISCIVGQTSYSCVLGMQIILLVNLYGYTSKVASTIYLILGIFGVLFGFVVLYKLTFKNDYVNISVKLLGRVMLYLLAFILDIKFIYVLALIYPVLTSQSHSHIIDAPYINRYEDKYQLGICNLKEMTTYLGKSLGTFLCGIGITYGIRYIFGFAFIFVLIQIILCYICLYLRHKEGEVK